MHRIYQQHSFLSISFLFSLGAQNINARLNKMLGSSQRIILPMWPPSSARLKKSMFAFICRFHNLPALVAFSSSFVQMTAGRDSRLATTAKMIALICWLELKLNVHAIHLQYPKIQSDSLENRLNSRNHTTGLFIANNRLHPLVVVWRVEV